MQPGEGGVGTEAELKLQSQEAARLQLKSPHGRDDLVDRHNYGPGPNLRPQAFGNWTQGGIKVPGSAEIQPDSEPFIPPQPHKPIPPGAHSPLQGKSPSNHIPSNQYKSIMPPFMDVMELPTGPPEVSGSRRMSRDRPGQRRDPTPRGRTLPSTEFAPPSIIDTEKLRRMDELVGDDWTYDDDNFDYNKRLQSDDEDGEQETGRTDPNWADQVEKVHSSQYNFYEEMKKPAGLGTEDEERRTKKKSEEVMKNIERARQRREEEENRYRRPGSEEFYKGEDRHSGKRFDEAVKENKTPTVERKDWGFEEKRGKPRHFDERRDPRFDERGDRFEPRREAGYFPQRFDRKDKEDKGRREEFRKFDDSQFEDDYKQYQSRKEPARSFDDRDRNRSSEEKDRIRGLEDKERHRSSEDKAPFTDFTNTEESR